MCFLHNHINLTLNEILSWLKLLWYRGPLGLLYNLFVSPSSNIKHLHVLTENTLPHIFHGGLYLDHLVGVAPLALLIYITF